MNTQTKNYFFIFVLGLVSTFIIFGNSLTDPNGFLSPDSANYLRLAERILDGNAFTVPNNGRVSAEDVSFAVWPVGYSTMIAATSYITSLDVFLASKTINLAMLIALILILYRKFGTDGLMVSTLLLSAGTLNIFSMTWSEAPFIFFLFLFCLHVGSLVSDETDLKAGPLAYLFALLACVFLMRYVGAFAIGVAVLVALLFAWRSRMRDAIKVLFVAILATIFVAGYLIHNKSETGYSTGMPRIPAPESIKDLLVSLANAAIRELILPLPQWDPASSIQNVIVLVFLMSGLAVVYKIFRTTKNKAAPFMVNYALIFIFVGLSYFGAITLSRVTTHFDGFSYRLLNPAFLLMFAGVSLYALSSFHLAKKEIYYFLTFAMILSVAAHSYAILKRYGQTGYFMADEERRDRYLGIPDDAIVIFGDIHLRYLRPSVHVAYPYFKPYSSFDEPIDVFLQSLDSSKMIYVDVTSRALNPNRYHPSVRRWVREYSEGSLSEYHFEQITKN